MSKNLKYVELTKSELDDLEKYGVVEIDYKGWSYQVTLCDEVEKYYLEKDYIVTPIAPCEDNNTVGNYIQAIFYEEDVDHQYTYEKVQQ